MAWDGLKAAAELDRSPPDMYVFLKTLLFPPKPAGKLMPESLSVVSMDELQVTCHHPEREPQAVPWSKLNQVAILTTDQGPMLCDVYWHLIGDKSECLIPQGATGELELIAALQKLPGFDHDKAIAAMCCTDNRTFVCWKKQAGEPPDAMDSR